MACVSTRLFKKINLIKLFQKSTRSFFKDNRVHHQTEGLQVCDSDLAYHNSNAY